MSVLNNLEPKAVFEYFEEISAVPRGSGDTSKIADFCMEFAKKNHLEAVRDSADNVVIFKPASKGYENSEPIILQGHLDMVCQKTEGNPKDFSKDGIDLLIEDGFIKADGTTLGADNGIAAAMIMAILADNTLCHPQIEAVFTSDEEIGMIGAGKLDFGLLSAKRMINLDSEELDVLTVSCAGGADLSTRLSVNRKETLGTKVIITLKGLKSGHSGVDINKYRVNADILAGRLLNHLSLLANFSLISIKGGDKANVIPNQCVIELCAYSPLNLKEIAEDYLILIKDEISAKESSFAFDIDICETKSFSVLDESSLKKLIYILNCVPNGVLDMSAEIEGLVETSLNLGILKTEADSVIFGQALRSNKSSSLKYLEEKLKCFFSVLPAETKASGHYPPWEFKENSSLQALYKNVYRELTGREIKVEAIHAGLECGVFASNIKDFDCIAIGPQLFDVHTVKERLDIQSVAVIYEILLKTLAELR